MFEKNEDDIKVDEFDEDEKEERFKHYIEQWNTLLKRPKIDE
jgi:hypothetical protein